jgi:hypothetical protein
MRKDLPPVRPTTTGNQLKVYITTSTGEKTHLLASDEVNGKYHIVVPCNEFWLTDEELEDAKAKMKKAQEKYHERRTD